MTMQRINKLDNIYQATKILHIQNYEILLADIVRLGIPLPSRADNNAKYTLKKSNACREPSDNSDMFPTYH